MVVLTAYCYLRPESVETALEGCRNVRGQSLLEPGCERYEFFQSTDDPAKIVFVEEWTSKSDLDLHFQQPAFNEFAALMADLVAAPTEIRIFESTLY